MLAVTVDVPYYFLYSVLLPVLALGQKLAKYCSDCYTDFQLD